MPRYLLGKLLLTALCLAVLSVSTTRVLLAKRAVEESLSDQTVLATVDKRKITLGDLQNKKIHDLRSELYKALMSRLTEQSLEMLARKDKTYNTDFALKISEEELKDFYLRNQLQRNGSFKEMGPRIRQFLNNRFRQEKLAAAFERAMASGLVKVHLASPGDFEVSLSLGNAYTTGNPRAKVMFMEFTDYQ